MKRRWHLLLIILLFVFVHRSFASDVILQWDLSPSSNVVKYVVYDSITNTIPKKVGSVGSPTNKIKIPTVPGTTHYFTVRAEDKNGIESNDSNLLVYKQVELPPPIIISCTIDNYGGYFGQQHYWSNVKLSWPALDKNRYQFTNYYVHMVTGVDKVYVVKTNFLAFKTLYEDVYYCYVVVSNTSGASSHTNVGTSLRISEKNPYQYTKSIFKPK